MKKTQDNSLSNLIKEIASKVIQSQKPSSFYYGIVISVAPLKIKLDTNLILTKEFLLVPKSLTNYKVNIEMDCYTENTKTDTSHIHTVNYIDKYTSDGDVENKTIESEIGSFDNTHNHRIKGTKTILIYNALKVNDKVILAQVQGGQEFIILDKVG